MARSSPWSSIGLFRWPVSPGTLRLASFATALLAGLGSGCGVVPRSKLDECHRLSQTLRSENGRLKDATMALRSRNQDLSERAVDDARRLTAQDEALQRLEKSVIAYQSERDALAAAFNELKRQVRLSANPRPDAREATSATFEPSGLTPVMEVENPFESGPLQTLAASRENQGWTFDPETQTLFVPADALFEPGTARVSPEAATTLSTMADVLKRTLREGEGVDLIGRAAPGDQDVRRASLASEGEGALPEPSSEAARRYLGASRAAIVRDQLLGAGGFEPERVRMSPPPTSPDPGQAGIQLRLIPLGPVPES
ncbi:MAG: hypothetical protein AB7I30_18795 [Isosphaeraceae bacterium]